LINDSLFCLGTNINFVNSDTINTINWYESGAFIALNNLNFSVTNTPNFSTVISAAVTNSCFYDSLNFPITTFGITPFNFPTDSAFICSQGGITYDFSSLFSTVIWDFPTIGSDTSTVFSVQNSSGSGFLSAFAVDANGCNTLSDSVFLIPTFSSVLINADLGSDCIGEEAIFTFSPNYSSAIWTLPTLLTSNNTPLIVLLSNQTIGEYILTVTDVYNCKVRDTLSITALPTPIVQLSSDTLLCKDSFMATPTIPLGSSFNWELFGAVDSIPILSDSWITLSITGANGCVFVDSIYIDAANCDDDLPNVFTPNGDGINDYFVIDEALLFPNNELIVLNRWGQEVYSMNGYNNTFDGGGLHDGVYFYVFYYDTTKPNSKKKEGFLTLIH
jgi:gliding motility-associated-like protein